MTPTDLPALVEPLWKRCEELRPKKRRSKSEERLVGFGCGLWRWEMYLRGETERFGTYTCHSDDALNAIIVAMVEWLASRCRSVIRRPDLGRWVLVHHYGPQWLHLSPDAPLVAALVAACNAVLDQEEK